MSISGLKAADNYAVIANRKLPSVGEDTNIVLVIVSALGVNMPLQSDDPTNLFLRCVVIFKPRMLLISPYEFCSRYSSIMERLFSQSSLLPTRVSMKSTSAPPPHPPPGRCSPAAIAPLL